ncbi:unnamed protein product [Phaedon cochleariae]|uniref:Uncharacterized protein n=1 Tax=Phaedon cochleariae TaxID=80249 RepID=A0A9P0DNS9_PHACE|nr:unnamed protein product [Phaedon cochleariae]
MTFVNRKTRLFMDRGDLKPERRRSESRLKTYPSAIDVRAWCDTVEDRRQHILELVTKEREKCLGKIIPLDVIIDSLMASKNADLKEMKDALAELYAFLDQCDLSDEDKKKLAILKSRLGKMASPDDSTQGYLATKQEMTLGPQLHDKLAQSSSGTDGLGSLRSYTVRSKGPARMVTKLKGIQPGTQVPVSGISSKTPGPATFKIEIKNGPPGSQTVQDDSGVDADCTPDGVCERRMVKREIGEASDLEGADLMDEVLKLQDELAARDALCEEQQSSIDALRNERDKLNNRIEDCLAELEGLRKLNNVADTGIPTSCKEEIEALEQEMQIMRSGNLSPEQEAEVIKKEVDVLKKYCMKLKAIEEDNERLKSERANLPDGDKMAPLDAEKIKELEAERDDMANKVEKLQKELLQYRDLPEDFEIYKNRSDMLDNALAERDQMQFKIEKMKEMEKELEELKAKADRADELEKTLKYYSKTDKTSDFEMKRTQSKCLCLEKELQNSKCEKDAMCKRIELMKNELDSLRCKATEAEMLRLERDRLQIKLNELSHVQVHNENLMLKCKCLESAVMERDAYKQKYEEVLGMECQCEMMREQVDASNKLRREKDALANQVMDLQACIIDQEDEIKRMIAQIDNLMRNKDETQGRMKDALANMRAEVEKKDQLIAASEEKLAAVQAQLKSSIQGVSCETTCYKTRIDEMERELCGARCKIRKLERELKEKEETMKAAKQMNKCEYESVGKMRRKLETAEAENKQLQEIVNKMVSWTGDEHSQKMLKQSNCAVRRVIEELGKQYKEWDHMRHTKGPKCKKPKCACVHPSDQSDSELNDDKLNEELRDIQREKNKLESFVKQIQTGDGPQECERVKAENQRLQEQLREEVCKRIALEEKLNKI